MQSKYLPPKNTPDDKFITLPTVFYKFQIGSWGRGHAYLFHAILALFVVVSLTRFESKLQKDFKS